MYSYLTDLSERLKAEPDGVDYNEMTFEEKQDAQALIEAGDARFDERDGRTVVKRHSPNRILRFVTMGAYA